MLAFVLITLLTTVAVPTMAQTPDAPGSIPAPADVAAPPSDAIKSSSGLASKIVKPGTGQEHPKATDMVTVNYTGWTTDGKMFDSSVARGKPSTFPLDRVIAGWTEGVQQMVVGETRRLWIPESLAYKGAANRPKGMLVFEVELVGFTEDPTKAPADVKAPPSDAKRTASGLQYKVIKRGVGARRPLASSTVTVHYSGWTTDGKLFDSSLVRGQPATFELDRVIPGWTEGLQLMVEGEKTRFWVPESLAYKGQSAPYGMLVFDIELVRFQQ